MTNYLIFDIGGTNTRVGFFRGGKLVFSDKFKTIKTNKLLMDLVRRVRDVKEGYRVKKFDGICVSAPGFLESEKLKLTAPVNLPKVRNLSLNGLRKYCKKLILENDANCAALGGFALEKRKGRRIKNLVCFTLGTGFGCGLIIDRKLYKGRGIASEFGHTTVDIKQKKEVKCNCNNFGCLEDYVSTRGLLKIVRREGLKVDAYKLVELAEKGNKKALSVYREFGEYLAVALVNITNTLDPEVIYLTGGLTNSGRFFIKDAVKEAKKRFFRGMNPKIRVYSKNLSILGGLELVKN